MNILDFQKLFGQILRLVKRYKHIDEITGENFNVFRVLKLEASEVRLHSAFLGELLNPRGSHGQKDRFLRLFLSQQFLEGTQIEVESCTVLIEKHTGFITEDQLIGGRIDIDICDKHDRHIIIENKIYADDQDGQILRYYNYSPNAKLLYLTLDGRIPTVKSSKHLKPEEDFKCISYSVDILKWLDLCRKETATLPIIRESITQYIHLIKYLTNQTINQTMQSNINQVIKENIEASIIIADNIKNAQKELLSEFGIQLSREINARGLSMRYKVDLRSKFNGFYIFKPEWEELEIAFQFQLIDKDLRFGIAAIKDAKDFPISTLRRKFCETLPGNTEKNNIYWPWIRKMEEPYDNWHSHEAWTAIVSGEILANVLRKIDKLLHDLGRYKL